MKRAIRIATFLAVCLSVICSASAQRIAERAKQSSGPKPSDAKLEELIKQMDSAKFAERRAADVQLRKAGAAAVAALAKAAESSSLEVRIRALKILGQFFESEDENLRSTAKSALEKLTKSRNRVAAQQARAILEEPPYDLPPGNWLGEGFVRGIRGLGKVVLGGGPGIRIGGGVVRIGDDSQVAVTELVDGQRTVDVIRGNGRGLLILDGEKRPGIEIHVREPQEKGRAKFSRYQAKDAGELAKKHPQVHELYEKFSGYQKNGVSMSGSPK